MPAVEPIALFRSPARAAEGVSGNPTDPFLELLDEAAVLALLPQPVIVVDGAGEVRWSNPAADHTFNRGSSLRFSSLADLPASQVSSPLDVLTSAGPRVMQFTDAPYVRDGVEHRIVTFVDVSALAYAEREMRGWEERIRLVGEIASIAFFDWSLPDDQIIGNSRFLSMLGAGQPEGPISRNEWLARMPPEDVQIFEEAVARLAGSPSRSLAVDLRLRGDDGLRWHQVRGSLVSDGLRLVGSMVDVQDQRSREEQLWQASVHDPLTGLANRPLFLDRVEQAVERLPGAARDYVAVLMIDIDCFKRVLETVGHPGADEVLLAVAARLRDTVGSGGTVARLDADVFSTLVPSCTSLHTVNVLGARVREAIAAAIPTRAGEQVITVSIGASASFRHIARDDLMAAAEASLLYAKRMGRDRLIVSEV